MTDPETPNAELAGSEAPADAQAPAVEAPAADMPPASEGAPEAPLEAPVEELSAAEKKAANKKAYDEKKAAKAARKLIARKAWEDKEAAKAAAAEAEAAAGASAEPPNTQDDTTGAQDTTPEASASPAAQDTTPEASASPAAQDTTPEASAPPAAKDAPQAASATGEAKSGDAPAKSEAKSGDAPTEIKFSDLGLHPDLERAVAELGYETPTPIQARAIPPLLAGRDLLGQAQTGTGKTAAFALPLLQRIDIEKHGVQAIVLTPTRELALQVAEAVRAYGRRLGERGAQVLPVYGGAPYHPQLKALRRGVPVVIGTPGRVKDHLERGSLNLSGVRFFGLDEADEMLKMGFIDDVEWILEQAPKDAQIALFSATMPRPIRRVADRFLTNPADVQIIQKTLTVANCEQLSLRLSGLQAKNFAVERILESEDHEAILIFTRTQMATADLAERLTAHGHAAEAIHGGMNQSNREAVVRRLRSRSTQVVVATDVAARGLDVDHIGLVINFDIPRDQEVYVHRVGRTGRAGRTGKAITFWQPREQRLLRSIERYSGQNMTPFRLPQQHEVLEMRRGRLATQIVALAGEGLEDFSEWVTAFGNDLSPSQIAAAALRLAWGDGPLSVPPEPERKQRDHHRDRERQERPRRPRDDSDQGPETEIVIPVGRAGRVRPGDIVGAIANEADLPGSVVGNINITERVTFVSVPEKHVERILEALEGVRLRGNVIHPRRADDRAPRGGGGGGGGGGGYEGRSDRGGGGGGGYQG
ncbi:MAG: DEAD/DEAH box helicase, partial [Planctomycetes bacterium]|nr:DEAD/DEAH box helicase [Planctomycetota bacterium]